MQSAITYPYLRRIEVEFEGLKGGKTSTMVSDGKRNTHYIGAQILKSIQSVGNVSTIWLYNLHNDTNNSFVRSETKVTLKAGWDCGPQKGMHLVFRGTLLMSQIRREGPDVVTTLHVQAGRLAATSANIGKTWSAGVPVRSIVEEIASSMDGVKVDPKLIRGVHGLVGEGGMPLHGDAEAVLNRLSRNFGFYWSILDDTFQTVNRDPDKDGGYISHVGTIRSPFLIHAESVLAGARRVQRGVEGSCLFNPAIRPGNNVDIQSIVDPRTNGSWRITQVQHALSCHDSGSFTTSFTGLGRRRG